MQKHIFSMIPVLSSPLNHTQKNQNKVMPLSYRIDFENKIKTIEKQNNEREKSGIKTNVFLGGMRMNYTRNYRNNQTIKTKTLTNLENGNEVGNTNINRNLGWGSKENRFFSLSIMRNGGGCGCG